MTVLASPKALVLKEFDLLFGTGTPDDFAAHASSVTFTPSGGTVTWAGGKQNTITDATVPTWTCGVDYAQDWASAKSLSRYFWDHEGEHIPVKFTPTHGSGPSFEGVVIVTSGAVGGAVNAVSTASVTLGMEGKPTLVPASGS